MHLESQTSSRHTALAQSYLEAYVDHLEASEGGVDLDEISIHLRDATRPLNPRLAIVDRLIRCWQQALRRA